ncbi:peroxidase family protein [Aurantiacibacter spongiae]|uniref:Peroxidase n=1 Tax=Aurantiacibacter spongiae TaxID=2488860 RepID=A0A3N5CMR6_9SPHN|nr:heme peroxidase family protein [Aurantiacibacter spongiae]RPF70233.1 hypothetical protein EG799_00255 [Aurantiacibacter spongiae]
MFEKVTHMLGLVSEEEILFSTPFDYMFPEAARSLPCLLPRSEATLHGLRALGSAMADPGKIGEAHPDLDSDIPAIYTYFGQFIDHDITARTDRDTSLSRIGANEAAFPVDPDAVVQGLTNGRRPQLDLDSVFGEGPALAPGAVTQSDRLYDSDYSLLRFVDTGSGRRDLPREDGRQAVIPDARNDENLVVSQIQFAFIEFYNKVLAAQGGDPRAGYIRARQLVRWAYQYVVVNDYLKRVCDPYIVDDTLANGPRFLGATAGRASAFMPLEFSTSAFRFGHSMIRPFYKLNGAAAEIEVMKLLGPAGQLDPATSDPVYFEPDGHLKADFVIDWNRFVDPGGTTQMARKIDTKLARGLFQLPLGDRASDPVLGHLARSNLVRAFNLSVPTGQAVADAFAVRPLTAREMTDGEDGTIADVLRDNFFDHRTPLWYYLLREAAVQQDGEHLGELGSRIVCETILFFIKADPNSYLNNSPDPAVRANGIDVDPGSGGTIRNLRNILDFADVI